MSLPGSLRGMSRRWQLSTCARVSRSVNSVVWRLFNSPEAWVFLNVPLMTVEWRPDGYHSLRRGGESGSVNCVFGNDRPV